MAKKELTTLEDGLEVLAKYQKKFGGTYELLKSAVERAIDDRDSFWKADVAEGKRRPGFICSKCGRRSAVTNAYCPQCGSGKHNPDGKARITR